MISVNFRRPRKADGEQKANLLSFRLVAVRRCFVSCTDLNGVEHAVEVTADSVYEAVAQGLRIFRENAWVDEIGRGLTTVKVLVKQPEVEHRVRIQDFERWLDTPGKTPAEIMLKARLRSLLGK